jgi:drug/metabolite transporter (DMT)-like permease
MATTEASLRALEGPPSERLKTAGLTTVVMLAFASNSLLCRAALEGAHADAASFTALRLAAGALVLGIVARRRGGPPAPPSAARGPSLALFAYAIGFSLAYLRIPAGVGALLLFAAVQITMIGGGLRGGVRPSAREVAGLVLALGGLAVLARPGLARPDPAGAALMLGAGVAWGLYSLRGRGVADPVAANAASFAGALPLALAPAAVAWALGAARLTPTGASLALVSGGVASGLFYAAWYAALRRLSAARAAIVQLAVPPLAALGGVLLLGETLSPRLAVASALVLGGIALAVAGRGPRGTGAAVAVGSRG